MIFVIAHSIRKKELHRESFSDKKLLEGARKVIGGLGISLGMIEKHNKLVKLYMTSAGPAARALFSVNEATGIITILMLRGKNDLIGENMSFSNPALKQEIIKNIALFQKDMENEAFDYFTLENN